MSKSLLCAGIITILSPMAIAETKVGASGYVGFTGVQYGDCTDSTKTLLSGLNTNDLTAQGTCANYVQPVIGLSAHASMKQFLVRASIETGDSDARALLSAVLNTNTANLEIKPSFRFSGDFIYTMNAFSGGIRVARTNDEVTIKDIANTVNVTRDETVYWFGPVVSLSTHYDAFKFTTNMAYLMADASKSEDDTTTADLTRRAFDQDTKSRLFTATVSLGYKPASNA